MKKLAIGCLIVLVLGGLAAAGVAYYAYRQVRSTYNQLAELGQAGEIERGLHVRGGFSPPASEELTPEQIGKLVRVQTRIKERLGTRFDEFQRKYKTLAEKETASIADLPAIVSAYRDLSAAWLDAKRAQVDALNEVTLSLEEYRWIREQSYRALGVPYVDLDVGKIAEDIRTGATDTDAGQLRGSMGPSGPAANQKLVEPYRKQLEQSVALASFGL